MKPYLILIFAFLLAQCIIAQDQNLIIYAGTITQDDLKKHLSIIASDEFEGRNTGDPGLEKAAKYLENEFATDKLTGPVKTGKNPFLQEFELEKKSWINLSLTSGKTILGPGNECFMLSVVEGINEYDMIFAGYGIYSSNYNDFENIDVKGKLAAFILGEPVTAKGKYLVTGTDSASVKADTTLMGRFMSMQPQMIACIMRGAKGVVIIEPDEKTAKKTIDALSKDMGNSQYNFPGKGDMIPQLPIIYMSQSTASKLFGIKLKSLNKSISQKVENGESPAGLFNVKVKIEAERKNETIRTANVIAMIEGTDKKDEYLAIIAHYDHMGVIKGDVYNGANDNGTGTVALLELAEAFAQAKADGHGPKRSILFIALTGEEIGLYGSKYYTDNPVFPMSNTVTALNLDELGRSDKEHLQNNDYIYIIGDDRLSTGLHQVSENTAKIYAPGMVLDYRYNAKDDPNHFYERSDHYNFAQKGVPVIFYNTGDFEDYHKPGDDIEKIDFPNYLKRVQLVFATAWQLANADERVKVDK